MTRPSSSTLASPPTRARRGAIVLRMLLALLIVAALVWSGIDAVRGGELSQFVSYFTNQSNLAFAIVVVLGVAWSGHRAARWDDLRGAVTFYLAMTGIIYALLVAPLDELLRWDIGWTGIVLHRIAPVAAVADWVLAPRSDRSSARRILWWQVYPIAYLLVTWLRGAITGWYPYEFLDPKASSWPQVLATTVFVLVAFLAVATLLHLVGGLRRTTNADDVSLSAAGSP